MTLDWTQIIIAFITAGGFTAMLTIREKKTGLFMSNVEKVSQEWQKIAESRKEMYDDLKGEYDKLSQSKEEQLRINANLRHKLDDANTEAAVNRLLKCEIVGCGSRVPPLKAVKQDSKRDLEKG